MCCLFGVYNYGNHLEQSDIRSVIASLGYAACERGTDATGIAYLDKGNNIVINKAAKAAYDFKFKLSDKTGIVMGHTRLTTQGNEKLNHNNHPFYGVAGGTHFALAHNGILHNDAALQKSHKLPKTKIETDSYVAVQLLEQSKSLNTDSIGKMAEELEGSFCFTILDNKKNFHFVKGDNPFAIIHNKELQAYFYASTDQILLKGLIDSSLFRNFKKALSNNPASIEEITLKNGDILTIEADGKTKLNHFAPCETFNMPYRWRSCYSFYDDKQNISVEKEYIDQLKDTASYMGLDADIVDILIEEGFSFDEVEAFIYDNDLEMCDML